MDTLRWFFGFLTVLGILWWYSGGPTDIFSQKGVYLTPPSHTLDNSWIAHNGDGSQISSKKDKKEEKKVNQIKKKIQDQTETLKSNFGIEKEDTSEFTGIVFLETGDADSSSLENEYLIINIKNTTKPISITGWKLKSTKTGKSIILKQGVKTIYGLNSDLNYIKDISVSDGDQIIIATKESPIGFSFKNNKCIGFFENDYNFTPSLNNDCPDLNTNLPDNLDEECVEYIENLNHCEAPKQIPTRLENNCNEYITNKINYKTCVLKHKQDSDFYKNEWRIFLNRKNEYWKQNNEEIQLLDKNEKIIDVLSY
jgi:hypothetical protein